MKKVYLVSLNYIGEAEGNKEEVKRKSKCYTIEELKDINIDLDNYFILSE